jgi:hypothetical protein
MSEKIQNRIKNLIKDEFLFKVKRYGDANEKNQFC